jgi:FkbM family methyltransferase
MKLENQNILILSNEPWGDIWYSKHNYANELSKSNKVFFLNPPGAFSITKLFNTKIREKIIHPNLIVVDYTNTLPVSLFNFWKLNDILVLNRLKKYFHKKHIRDILFWTFDPIRLAFPEILHPKQIIVHAVDAYIFSYPSEPILAKKADHVFCVSDKIVNQYKNYNNSVTVLPHAIPDDEFISTSHAKNKILTGVFIGKMDSRIDIEFNVSIFKSFPSIQFKMIGLISDEFLNVFKKEGLQNITLIPPIKSNEIKKFVNEADFCFIFKKIYDGNNIYSHKLLQYLAQGKPIFGTDFSDIPSELKNALYLSNNISEVKNMLLDFSQKGEPSDKAQIRINYAKQHTFSKTINVIEGILKLTPKSNSYLYYSEISNKTRVFNFFRKALANSFMDKLLASLMRKGSVFATIISRIIPPEYLYKDPSWRFYSANGIKMKLNISNLVDHCVYFSTEQRALNEFIKHLKPSDTVLDIGANIGNTTLLFSKACHKGNIISIEPSKVLFDTLENHVTLNEINNVKCLNIGLGAEEKTGQLYKVSENNSGMNRIFESEDIPFSSERIIIKKLDNMVAELNIGNINAIKIDVEGYEYKVLKGAYNTLKTKQPTLLIEVDDHNLREQGSNPAEVFKLLKELNYSVFEADNMKDIELLHDYSDVHFDVICFKKNN